jgi:large subunit ribosomal protein L6
MLSFKNILYKNELIDINIGQNFIKLKSNNNVLCKKKNLDLKIIQKSDIFYFFFRNKTNMNDLLIILKRFKKLLFIIKYGYSLKLRFVGIGYKMDVDNKNQHIELKIGYALPVIIKLPKTVSLKLYQNSKNLYILNSIYPTLIQNIAYKIRSFRKPEPYKGKGIRYQGEYVKRKQGKKSTN